MRKNILEPLKRRFALEPIPELQQLILNAPVLNDDEVTDHFAYGSLFVGQKTKERECVCACVFFVGFFLGGG